MNMGRLFSKRILIILLGALLLGLVPFGVASYFFVMSFVDLLWVILVLVIISVSAALLLRFGLNIWFSLSVIAYVAGLVYAGHSLLVQDLAGNYRAAIVIVAIFTTHGLLVGAFVEAVARLHRLSQQLIEFFKEKTSLKLEDE
jgi:hypothetical protein